LQLADAPAGEPLGVPGPADVPAARGSDPGTVFGAPAEETFPRRVRRDGRGFNFQGAFARLLDIPTLVFGAGAFFVILFLFLPLIDKAKVSRRQALIQAGNNRQERLDRLLQEKEDASSEEKERRKKEREAWEKEKVAMQEDIEDAKVSTMTSVYWYRYGMMFGFLLLAFAALAYLNPSQPTIRRVVGAIVIVAQVLLVFIVFVFSSSVSTAYP
jgi:hypothetical protein